MSSGDDYPTEPVRPRQPIVREREVETGYDPVDPRLTALDDRLRNLRGLLALVAVIALAALGLSIYDVVHNSGDRRGASQGRVAALTDRVSRLEGKTSNSADTTTTSSLAGRIGQKADKQDLQKLSDELTQLRSTVTKGTDGSSSNSALTQLNARVDRLAQQVATLQASGGTSTSP